VYGGGLNYPVVLVCRVVFAVHDAGSQLFSLHTCVSTQQAASAAAAALLFALNVWDGLVFYTGLSLVACGYLPA